MLLPLPPQFQLHLQLHRLLQEAPPLPLLLLAQALLPLVLVVPLLALQLLQPVQQHAASVLTLPLC